MWLMLSTALHAQKEVTQFLGIPVDGTKAEMIRKLQEKGYRLDPKTGLLKGQFNGKKVEITVQTHKNKVWRIIVSDDMNRGEGQIRIDFNKLYRQFANNPKYLRADGEEISEDEEISYQMVIKNKFYEASFTQQVSEDFLIAKRELLSSKYTPEELEKKEDKIKLELAREMADIVSNKLVWFRISGSIGRFGINIFYENRYNMAKGEDL